MVFCVWKPDAYTGQAFSNSLAWGYLGGIFKFSKTTHNLFCYDDILNRLKLPRYNIAKKPIRRNVGSNILAACVARFQQPVIGWPTSYSRLAKLTIGENAVSIGSLQIIQYLSGSEFSPNRLHGVSVDPSIFLSGSTHLRVQYGDCSKCRDMSSLSQ